MQVKKVPGVGKPEDSCTIDGAVCRKKPGAQAHAPPPQGAQDPDGCEKPGVQPCAEPAHLVGGHDQARGKAPGQSMSSAAIQSWTFRAATHANKARCLCHIHVA